MKNKNIDIVPQIFLAVVGVILTGIIIYYVINSARSMTRAADIVIANTEGIAAEYAKHDITMYDGEEIRGSEVVNFIKKQLGDYDVTETAPIYVEVFTKVSDSTVYNKYENKKHIKDIKNFSNMQHYIKPTAVFKSEVIINANKVILGVRFTQN
ncbi:MAG TPA: hypothetical protein GX002_07955 [Clostridiales bacterium]|nr:hypothetical protein [Clostridiales bacterium]